MKLSRAKKKGKALSDEELIGIVNRCKQATNTTNVGGTELSERRKNNLKRYLGQPYGDERKGQSQVVTRQCLEAVEWTMPSLMRVFASTDRVAEFRPTSAQDVNQARLESEHLNHVIMVENEGFSNLFTFIKSVLMNPVGYIKAYPVEDELSTVETYEHLLPMGLAELMKDSELEPIEQEEVECEVDIPGVGPMLMPALNVKFRRTQKFTRIAIEPVPPEELSIDPTWNKVSLEGCPYLCHTTYPMRSQLIERGYSKALVDELPSATQARANNDETRSRAEDTLGSDASYSDTSADRSTDLIEVDEHYLWVDTDGDGVAEYRMVTVAGQYVFENEEIDDHSIIAGCAVPIPHAHAGLAWQELVEDLQKIYTTLTRQLLNNAYRVNNPRTVAGRGVNLNDLINDLPNSPIRAKDVNQLRMEPVLPIAANIIPIFQTLDAAKESRTGVSRGTMGLDADTLSRVANGAFYASLEQANQRLELLARVIAEMSIKPLFLKVHKLILTHYTNPREIEMSGVWTPVNPGEWKARKDLKMLVGLGTGNKQAQAMALDRIMAAQEKLMMAGSPMVTPQNIYASLTKLVSLAEGLPSPDTYFTDPAKLPPGAADNLKKGGPEADLAAAQMEMAKVELEKAQMENQAKIMQIQQKAAADNLKNQQKIAELQAKLMEAGKKSEQGDRALDIQEFKATTGAEIEAAKIMQMDDKLKADMDRADWGGGLNGGS